jgi:hypothetical protein
VMRGRLDARRTLKSLVADLRFILVQRIEFFAKLVFWQRGYKKSGHSF